MDPAAGVEHFHNMYCAASNWPAGVQHRQYMTAQEFVRPGAVVIELGAGEGSFTCLYLAAGANVHSVDICDFAGRWDSGNWHFLCADDLSVQAQEWFPAECDVLFIDSSHGYDHTLAELRLHASRVRPGGTILLHDTEYSPEGPLPEPAGEVALAISAWCQENGISWENLPGASGLGIIRIEDKGAASDS